MGWGHYFKERRFHFNPKSMSMKKDRVHGPYNGLWGLEGPILPTSDSCPPTWYLNVASFGNLTIAHFSH